MPLLDTCKFEEVVIKTEGAMPRAMSNMGLFFLIIQGQITLKNCTIWLKFELVREFMLVLVIRKFDQISTENIVAVPETTFLPL